MIPVVLGGIRASILARIDEVLEPSVDDEVDLIVLDEGCCGLVEWFSRLVVMEPSSSWELVLVAFCFAWTLVKKRDLVSMGNDLPVVEEEVVVEEVVVEVVVEKGNSEPKPIAVVAFLSPAFFPFLWESVVEISRRSKPTPMSSKPNPSFHLFNVVPVFLLLL